MAILKNCTRYLPYAEDMSRDYLFLGVYDYVYNEKYSTTFGDLVPVITPHALGMRIMIVCQQGDETFTVFIEHRENHTCENVFIFKDGDQYDALVTTFSAEHRIFAFEKNRIYADCILSNCATDNKETDKACCLISTVNGRATLELKCVPDVSLLPSNPTRASDSKRGIKMCSWNINGLTQDRLHDEIIRQYFSKFDVIVLTETWSDGKDGYEHHNIEYIDFSRKSRHANAKRASDGIGVIIIFDISDGVEVFRNVGAMLVWLKL